MTILASLTCDIPNSNNNWKWVLMTKDEYLLAQCRQYGYDPNLEEDVKQGCADGKIFDCPKLEPAGLYESPKTKSVAQIHIAESKHNKASANYTHFDHINLACVLGITWTQWSPTSALELLQALENYFAHVSKTWASGILPENETNVFKMWIFSGHYETNV